MTMFRCSWARGITDAVIMQFSPLSLRGALCDEAISHRVAAESRDCFAALAMTALHVAVFAEELHPAAFVLRAAGALGYRGAAQFLDDRIDGLGRGLDREGAGSAAQEIEEHTSELQSPCNLVCRLLLEKKNNKPKASITSNTDVTASTPPPPPESPPS